MRFDEIAFLPADVIVRGGGAASLGYDLLLKLAELSLAAPEADARSLWESVLAHGPEAHDALQHFIRGPFPAPLEGR